MPKYYHIHRGVEPSELEKKFIDEYPLFFSKKNSKWNMLEKDVSESYGGYREYEIDIPKKLFTTSFHPKAKGKVVKINKDNINEYIESRKKYGGHHGIVKEMNKRNIIGIDCTLEHPDAYYTGFPEGFIWKKPSSIKIKLIEVVKL
jgi:hypothetical protein